MNPTDHRKTWYGADKGEAHKLAYAAALRCITRGSRRDRYRTMRLLAHPGLESSSEHKIVANMIDSVVAKVGKSEVMPVARATGIRRSRQERAKRLSHWLRGQVMALGVHRKARLALRDSATYGSGVLYPHRGLDDKPTVDVVWVGDVGVEENEEEARNVRTLYRAMSIDRTVVAKRWPSKAGEIKAAGFAFQNEKRSRVVYGDPITVVECWRLTTGGVVGRHIVATSKCALVDEEWDSQSFPLKFHHWVEDTERFFGVGMAEGAAGSQRMLDRITEKIEESFDQGGNKILVDSVSDVNVKKITNTPYEEVRYTSAAGGHPPQWISPPAISSDYRMQQETIIQRAYQDRGVDRLSAQSQKPAGVISAVGMETYSNIESERFYWQTKDYEQLVVQTGEGLIEVAEEIADDPELRDTDKADILCSTKADVRIIRYQDARMPADKRSIEVEATSQFSATLSGRIQQADTLRNLGVIKSERQTMALLDDPNLYKLRSLALSAQDLVEVQVERCLAGKRQTPDGTSDLPYALEYAMQELQRAMFEQDDEDEPDEELEQGMAVLRDYIADVQTLLDQLEADQSQPPPPVPPGVPGVLPEMAGAP